MDWIFRLAKTVHLSVFVVVVCRAMSREQGELASERSPSSIKIVCR